MPSDASPTPDPAGTILVSGSGRIAVEPDLAELRLGVAVTRPSVADARAVAATTMTAILEAVGTAGVEARDIRTALLSIQPRYDHRGDQGVVLVGHELSNIVEVTVRDLGRLGPVVDGALGAGATSLDELRFRVADPAPAERAARLAAMAEARARADTLAEAAGLVVEGAIEIAEAAPGHGPAPYESGQRMRLAADVATPIEAGSLEVAVALTVRYRVR